MIELEIAIKGVEQAIKYYEDTLNHTNQHHDFVCHEALRSELRKLQCVYGALIFRQRMKGTENG